NNISVLLGRGDGTFQQAVNYPAGLAPRWVVVADFNGDGKPDLAVAEESSGAAGILLGNGDGTFQPVVNYATGVSPWSIAAGDFNGDGKLDLVTANLVSNNVSVLLGNGNGTFQSALNYSAGINPSSLAIGDFNHDGKADLAVADMGSNSVSVLLGNGNGTFQAPVSYGVGPNPISVVAADLNGDSKTDLVVADNNNFSSELTVLLGNGDGTFQPGTNYSIGNAPGSLAVADLNGDGRLDIAVSQYSANILQQAYAFNVTVVPHPAGKSLGYLTMWPQGQPQPGVSTLNNPTATDVANAAIVPAGMVEDFEGAISVYASNDTDLVVDINGYFGAPASTGTSLYTAVPCRVIDTRNNGGHPFQGERTVNVIGSACAPPSAAQTYVLNATVVPSGSLGYLTLWPDGEGQPVASTLNALDGFVTSNMAILPTTNGFIDAYASNLMQLVLDISSFFAPEAPH
ncbi:MAG TPA: VCBS repeat-containing protein, partial [Candidatus Binatia bacterium]|nr:VCBS repeat-containing protein [Candidatus Binatia bacterium]